MVQLKVASMFFFSGLAVVIALVVVVYVVAWIYDRASGAPEALLTVTELEERRIASALVKEAGLAGLLPDEKNRVMRHFFQGKASDYVKQHDIETPPDRQVVKNGISSASEEEAKSSKNGTEADTSAITNSNNEKPARNEERPSKKRKSKKSADAESNCCNYDKGCNGGSACCCSEDSNDLGPASSSKQSIAISSKTTNEVSDELQTAGQHEEGKELEAPGDSTDRDAEEGVCPICLVEFENEENVIIGSSCGHMFHFECLLQWFEKSHSDCPLCRSDMMNAEDFLASAYEVLGEQRVNKLKHINEQAAKRLEALEAHRHREAAPVEAPRHEQSSSQAVNPTAGRDPPARLAPTATADTSRLTVVMVQ